MRGLFLIALCASAQVETPKLGTMLDRNGAARPVFGITASVTIGDPAIDLAATIACTATRCVSTEEPAVIAMEGETAYVYKQGRLFRDDAPVDINVTGEILSIRVVEGALEFAVRRDDGTWIVQDSDIAIGAIPNATGPVMLRPGAILYAAGDEVVLRRSDASERRFPIHADTFVQMSGACIQIRSAGANYALHLATERLFQLPEAP